MSDDDVLFRDPNEETKLRWQNDKETLGASSIHEPPPWKIGDQLNDFVLEELLGVGSSGFVYRVLDARTNRHCALKLLKHGTPDDLLRNKLGFRRMMSVEHPNLLRVDQIYQLGSYIALSMEEVDGLTLGKSIKEYTKLDPELAYEQLLKLMREFASGLASMHANGYIHRDIKPENLMVDSDGNGRVIDYGLVDSYALDQTTYSARGFLLGTPHYFAPEVIWSQRYLPAGDIFSLGIVTLDALRILQRSAEKTSSDDAPASAPLNVERSDISRLDDAERIDEAIQDLSDSVPSTILKACREMLERNPADRPTAMEMSRIGLPPTERVFLAYEQPMVGRAREQDEVFSWIDGIFSRNIGRLHLTGPSGIGKSRLVEEIVKYIESKPWGQVFCARCRLREDQPLQAFDQLCDAITNRYMQGDRERLELDPVSVEMLQSVFPVLKNILTCCTRLTPAGRTTERLDALEAAARMSEQLRRFGPLFLVVDDSQWADRDSLSVLDRLQSVVGGEGLGIITVSREVDDPQLVPASKYISLGPLDLAESIEILATAAARWSVNVPPAALRELAEATDGTPFRLRQLADEFRPGGALADMDAADDSSVTNLGRIDHLWRQRVERLGDDAKQVLPFVVAAGGRVSTQQLGELTGLGDSVDAAISELARHRLVSDEVTGGDCIAIYHDHVADELVKTLSQEARRSAHHAWASLLARQDNPEQLAARIAGHFFEAGEPGRAVAHAILAAEDAERLMAKTEAARWYARVVPHVDGEEKVNQLRNAARCYYEADFPVKAAECYQQLASLVDDEDERIECQLLATTLWIRSGRCWQVRDQLHELAQLLGLPKPKSALLSRLALTAGAVRLFISGNNAMLARITSEDWPAPGEHGKSKQSLECQPNRRVQQTMRFCLSLIRPMAIFDNLYAAELNVAASLLCLKHGNAVQQVHVAVGQAVFGCYDKGDKRIQAEAALLKLKPQVAKLGDSRATADLWAGNAYSHALACRWDQVSQPVGASLEHYEAATDSLGFELANTRWLDLWATWHLGRWNTMQQISTSMFDDATRRNDLFQLIMTTSGFGGGAWLARDKTDELRRIRANAQSDCSPNQTQMFQVFDWIASIQSSLYEARFSEAWAAYEWMEPNLRRTPYRKIQLIRVCRRSLGALVALHNLSEGYSDTWALRVRVLTHQLRQEQISYPRVLANLYDGLLKIQVARANGSDEGLEAARLLLLDARSEARDRHLRPYRLAAEDALAEIHTGTSLRLLADRMKSQHVVRPNQLKRLYTVSK